ncbi:MAG TPA: aminotransferase class V-fold PLP-dependent enzyme [Terriglobia bacterium]|nr:aminotransferase class V-fold PLP-dependent enzyme [Terriglobia bacterium]
MTNNFLSRRKFFKWGGGVLAASTMMTQEVPRLEAAKRGNKTPAGEDYYSKLGVTPFINAAGTYTILTASIMPPQVRAAVDRAALSPVHLIELQKAAGEYLAKKLRCEAAMVSDGAASAVTLSTAACMTRGRERAILNVPNDVSDLPNEVLIQRAHRYEYDHAIRCCGVKMVEVETLEDYDRAFTPRTAMAHFFNAAQGGQIGREDWVRVAHKHGVPASNDAAADVPPISRLWEYTQMGFDLVQFSGGKGLRGPQNSGLLLGRKDLIEAAALNNCPYSDTVGRGMKVSKEQIVGMVAAVDWFLEQDEAEMRADFQKRAELIAAAVQKIPSVETQIFVPPVANNVPHLLITYDMKQVKISAKDVQTQLLQGTPNIALNPATGRDPGGLMKGLPAGENVIVVGVWMMQPGEDQIVARRLHEVLSKASAA